MNVLAPAFCLQFGLCCCGGSTGGTGGSGASIDGGGVEMMAPPEKISTTLNTDEPGTYKSTYTQGIVHAASLTAVDEGEKEVLFHLHTKSNTEGGGNGGSA